MYPINQQAINKWIKSFILNSRGLSYSICTFSSEKLMNYKMNHKILLNVFTFIGMCASDRSIIYTSTVYEELWYISNKSINKMVSYLRANADCVHTRISGKQQQWSNDVRKTSKWYHKRSYVCKHEINTCFNNTARMNNIWKVSNVQKINNIEHIFLLHTK